MQSDLSSHYGICLFVHLPVWMIDSGHQKHVFIKITKTKISGHSEQFGFLPFRAKSFLSSTYLSQHLFSSLYISPYLSEITDQHSVIIGPAKTN